MYSLEYKKQQQLTRQYYTFRIFFEISMFMVWAYYYILLYIRVRSLNALILEQLLFSIGLWVGAVIGAMVLDGLGYLRIFRFSFIAQIVVMMMIIVLINQLPEFFALIAIFRGIAIGLYWPADYSFNLKEVHGVYRDSTISAIQSIQLIFKIIIPFLAGVIISYLRDYRFLFTVAIFFMGMAVMVPWEFNKIPISKFRPEEISKILKKRKIDLFGAIVMLDKGMAALYTVFFLIVPYLIIQDEFGVGLLGTFIGVAAALAAILHKRLSFRTKVNVGYIAFFVYALFTSLVGFIWSLPVLVIRSLGVSFTLALGTTTQNEIDFRIREKILGDFTGESAIEMNLVIDTFYLFGRVVVLSLALMVASLTGWGFEEFIRVSIIVLSIYSPILYHFYVLMNDSFRIR